MVFGWYDIRPKFYAMMNAALPQCLEGEKASLPGAWGTIASPALIQDSGPSNFFLFPPTMYRATWKDVAQETEGN